MPVLETCKALVLAFFVLGFLLSCALHGLAWLRNDLALTFHHNHALATVVDVIEDYEERDDGHSGVLVYDYTYVFRAEGHDVQSSSSCEEVPPPSTFAVEYEPDNPRNCREAVNYWPRKYLYPVFVLVLGAAVIGHAAKHCGESVRGSMQELVARRSGVSVHLARHQTVLTRLLVLACIVELFLGVVAGQRFTGERPMVSGITLTILVVFGVGIYSGLHIVCMIRRGNSGHNNPPR